jgi:hypothetical protein
MRDEDREARRQLALRLEERLNADGYERHRPNKGKVKGDDSLSLELTHLELAEIIGALRDTFVLEGRERGFQYWHDVWEKLDGELRARGAKNPRAVLRDFGLLDAGRKRRALERQLGIARHYCQLIRSYHVESPERERWELGFIHGPREARLFGEVQRGDFEAGTSPHWERWDPNAPPGPTMPGEAVWNGPLSTVEAVHVITRWYGFEDAFKAREALIDARKALKANPDHAIVSGQFPPPRDHFEIPDPARLSNFHHIDVIGRKRR